jgi:hypothetical protein
MTHLQLAHAALLVATLPVVPAGADLPVHLVHDAQGKWWFTQQPASSHSATAANTTRHFLSAGVDHVMYSGDNFGTPYYKQAVEKKYVVCSCARAALRYPAFLARTIHLPPPHHHHHHHHITAQV